MKYAIVFSSQTGNTKQLAEAVSSVLPQADLCFFGSPSQEALQAERLFIGFWTDKGRCNQEITDFLKTLKGKEVFLFGTAGFGGSQEYFDKILSSVFLPFKNTSVFPILSSAPTCARGKCHNRCGSAM